MFTNKALKACFLVAFTLITGNSYAQKTFAGRILTLSQLQLPFASIQSADGTCGTIASIDGQFVLTCADSIFTVRCLGYLPKTVLLHEDVENLIHMSMDIIGLNQFIVSANRIPLEIQKSPILINTITSKTFQQTQSFGLVDGLKFAPGVRTENNCQSCGFSGVRLNGLPSPYTQILVNSRPIYSALQSIYGLEQFPSIMLDRVEISKGAGSVMYGGNAIAGTINIITKAPLYNETKVESMLGLIGNESFDFQQSFALNRISKNGKHGLSMFLNNRNRQEWDANKDGYTEIPKLNSFGTGLQSYSQLATNTELNVNAYMLLDDRRGGNDLHLKRHESIITEAIEHKIVGGSISLKQGDEKKRGQLSLFAAGQRISRKSYYGGSILLLEEIDPLNAYGSSEDYSSTIGFQFNKSLRTWDFLVGSDIILNKTIDEMPGYNRQIDQSVNTSGTYFQLTKRWKNLSLTPGIRYDLSSITSKNKLGSFAHETYKKVSLPLPRIAMLYKANNNLKFRANVAKGYRGPQVFDEDLHIEMAAGSPQVIMLAESLNVETSTSLSLSAEYLWQTEFISFTLAPELFFTELNNPFTLVYKSTTPIEGIMLLEKQNGSKVHVNGLNFHIKMAYKEIIGLEGGLTLQNADYLTEQIISIAEEESENDLRLNSLLRTPRSYGYLTLKFVLNKKIDFDYSNVYTGKMWLTQIQNSPDNNQNSLKLHQTEFFLEHSLRIGYKLNPEAKRIHQLTVGIRNFTNKFQRDLGIGPHRDASFVYGPNLPRTLTLSLSFSL